MKTGPHEHLRSISPSERWADRVMEEAVREMDPLDRLERMRSFSLAARELALGRLRERYPSATQSELDLRLFALRYGRDLALQFFGWDPELMGW